MKAILISDTHSMHGYLKNMPPDADAIIHSGDVSKRGTKQQVLDFLYWYSHLPYRYKIFIAGNHDFLFEDDPEFIKQNMPQNLIYLENEGVEIEGIKMYGSPISPWFHDWAFNRYRGADIKKYWDKIPLDTQYLITHGPAYQILDRVNNRYNTETEVGCHDLKNRLFALRDLKMFQFGHIHEAASITHFNNGFNDVLCCNASCLDDDYCLHVKHFNYVDISNETFEIKMLN